MKDIKFYGLNRKENMALVGELGNLQALVHDSKKNGYGCPIKIPYFYTFNLDEIKAIKPNSFPWPVVARIAYVGNHFVNPKLVSSLNGLKAYTKQMKELETEDKNPVLLISRPPIKLLNYDRYNFYLAKDYIAAHNLKTNDVVLFNTNSSNLFKEAGLNTDFVYKIICGTSGFLFDGFLTYDDPRLNDLKVRSIVDSFQDQTILASFRTGYRNAFFSEFWPEFRGVELSMASGYLGDPYTLGEIVGYDMSTKLHRVFEQACIPFNGLLTQETLIKLKLSSNDQLIDRLQKLAETHNKIQTAELADMGSSVVEHLNSWDKNLNWEQVVNIFKFAYNCVEFKGMTKADENNSTLLVPESIKKVETEFRFSSKIAQLRIISADHDERLRVRFQTQSPNFEQFVSVDDAPLQRYMFWQNHVKENLENDFMIKPKDVDGSFEEFKKQMLGLNYNRPSLFGTSVLYVKVVFKDQWFCDKETGMKLFSPQVLKEGLGNVMAADYAGNANIMGKVLNTPSEELGKAIPGIPVQKAGSESSYNFDQKIMIHGSNKPKTMKSAIEHWYTHSNSNYVWPKPEHAPLQELSLKKDIEFIKKMQEAAFFIKDMPPQLAPDLMDAVYEDAIEVSETKDVATDIKQGSVELEKDLVGLSQNEEKIQEEKIKYFSHITKNFF